jgi:hypothetical protein
MRHTSSSPKCLIFQTENDKRRLGAMAQKGLQNRCSTTELTRHINGLGLLASRFATGLPPLRWQFRSYSVRLKAASTISAALALVFANK